MRHLFSPHTTVCIRIDLALYPGYTAWHCCTPGSLGIRVHIIIFYILLVNRARSSLTFYGYALHRAGIIHKSSAARGGLAQKRYFHLSTFLQERRVKRPYSRYRHAVLRTVPMPKCYVLRTRHCFHHQIWLHATQ